MKSPDAGGFVRKERNMQRKDYPKLRNCPFCGGNEIGIDSYKNSGLFWFFIKCDECLCSGPVSDDFDGAKEAWNMRVTDNEVTE